jgi:hypothetical protein
MPLEYYLGFNPEPSEGKMRVCASGTGMWLLSLALLLGAYGSVVIEAICYKTEGRELETWGSTSDEAFKYYQFT